ncbi:MAG: glycerophosphodiester phosphodiesterase family protein [Candidatus Nealsonbacteria bacterium]
MQKMFLKIGHRGACGYEPENTMASFKKALELGVDAIEFDVYTLKDGQTVVFHDDTLDRTTNGTGMIMDKTFKEIRQLDAGKGEKIPTPEEALDLIDKKVLVNIELKGEKTAKPTLNIIEKYIKEKGWSYDDFIVSSFNIKELRDFRSLNKDIRIGICFSDKPKSYDHLVKELNAYSVNPNKEWLTKEFIDKAHEKGLKVFSYTVNEMDDISRLKGFGIDGIFSNYPDRL